MLTGNRAGARIRAGQVSDELSSLYGQNDRDLETEEDVKGGS